MQLHWTINEPLAEKAVETTTRKANHQDIIIKRCARALVCKKNRFPTRALLPLHMTRDSDHAVLKYI
jgi:hypothetical protein